MLTVTHGSGPAHALPASSIARLKPTINNIEIRFNGECWLKYLVNHINFTRTAFSALDARYSGYPAGKTASGGNVVACIILRTESGSVEVLCLQKYPDMPIVVFTTQPLPQQLQMGEREKMLSGEPFRPYSAGLHDDRQRCKRLLHHFNNTTNPAIELSLQSLERHLAAIFAPQGGPARLGREIRVDQPFYCDYGTNISIGDRVAIGTNCKFMDSGKISIGRNCTDETNVTINTIKPPKDHKSVKGPHGVYIAKVVRIGDNVFIGANSICSGVRIGSGAIIEHGSIVRRDVPSNVVVSGGAAGVKQVYFDEG